MYIDAFGMQEMPFTYTPNTDFYVELDSSERTLKNLDSALAHHGAFVVLSGRKGSGKTLICRKLMENLDKRFLVVALMEPYTSPANKLASIAQQMNLAPELRQQADADVQCAELISCLQGSLPDSASPPLLIVDEAQALDDDNLDVLLDLIHARRNGQRIFRVLMSCQPEFLERIREGRFDQLRTGMIQVNIDQGMNDESVFRYINHRVRRSGHYAANLFSPEAIRLIAYAARGNPLLVNQLCHNALANAVNDRMVRVDVSQVTDAVRQIEGASFPLLIKPLITSSGSLSFNLVLVGAFVVNMILLMIMI